MNLRDEVVHFKSSDGTRIVGIVRPAVSTPQGAVVLAHGITVEKNEGGFYADLADRLSTTGFATLRFDFRGHGDSDRKSTEVTISGEVRDLEAAVEYLRERQDLPLGIVGTSFGGGIAVIYASQAAVPPFAMALLSPVLDYRRTFLEPRTVWTRKWFGERRLNRARERGSLNLDGFKLGVELLQEFEEVRPYELIPKLGTPTLVVHGDADSMVPFDVARDVAESNAKWKFVRVAGADHGFEGHEQEVFDEVVGWFRSHVRSL